MSSLEESGLGLRHRDAPPSVTKPTESARSAEPVLSRQPERVHAQKMKPGGSQSLIENRGQRIETEATSAGSARQPAKCLGGKTLARSQAETQADAMNLHHMPLPTARGLQSSSFNGFGNNSPPAVSRSPGRRARWSRVLAGVASSSNSPSEPADCCRAPAEDWRQAGPAPFAWS